MTSCTVEELLLDEDKLEIIINNLKVDDPTLYNLLVSMGDEDEQREFIERTMSIGFEVIQMMDQTKRVDYVRSEFELMKKAFDQSFDEVFSDKGKLTELLDEYFGDKGEVTELIGDHFGEEGSVLCHILNHTDEETPLGKFRKDLHSILDINSEDTAFFKLKACIDEGFKEVVEEIKIKEAEDVARADERSKGTLKGRDFQTFLTEITDGMASTFEDTVSFVGDDAGLMNKVGDVLIEINPGYTKGFERSIILEAKNTGINLTGKDSFLKELDMALENRSADYAIGAVHEAHVGDSIGEFRRFAGNRVIVKIPEDNYPMALEVAYKVARAEIISEVLKGEKGVDATKVLEKIEEIKSKLKLMRATKMNLTSAKKSIDSAYKNLESMEADIKECSDELEKLLKSGQNSS